jgi:predicted YcjX-like family ATPase
MKEISKLRRLSEISWFNNMSSSEWRMIKTLKPWLLDFRLLYLAFRFWRKVILPDHVKKILRSLPAKWRPKVTAFQEEKNLDEVTLESLTSSPGSHTYLDFSRSATMVILGVQKYSWWYWF